MSSLSRDSFLTFATSGASFLFGLVSSIILARFLGPEGKGIYTVVSLVPLMVYTFGNCGLGYSVMYYLAREKTARQAIFFKSLRLAFLLAALLYGLGSATLPYWRRYYPEVPEELFQLAFPLVLILTLQEIFKSAFIGAGRVGGFNLINLLGNVIGIFFLVGALFFPGDRLANLVAASLISYVLILFISNLLLRKSGILGRDSWKTKIKDQELLTYGAKVQVVNVAQFLNYRTDQFLIAFFLDPAALGLYTIAVGLTEKIWMAAASIQMALLPRTPSLGFREGGEMVAKGLRHIILLTLVLLSGLAGAGFLLIPALFGRSFQSAYWPMLVLLPGTLFISAWKILGTFFLGTNQPGVLNRISLLALAVNLSLNLLLIPRWGIVGAAAASSVSYSFTGLAGLAILHRQTGISFRRLLLPGRAEGEAYRALFLRLKNKLVTAPRALPGKTALPSAAGPIGKDA